MQLIDGYNGGIPHIDAQMIRDHNISLYGTGDYVLDVGNKFNYEIVNNNEIKIYDGYAVMQGARLSVGYGQSITAIIENGTSGYNRNDIICFKYTKNEETLVETVTPEVVKGTINSGAAVDPAIVTGNIRSGAVNHQMKLYRVRLSGTNIVGVDKLYSDADLGGYRQQLEPLTVDYIIDQTVVNGTTIEKWANGKMVKRLRAQRTVTSTKTAAGFYVSPTQTFDLAGDDFVTGTIQAFFTATLIGDMMSWGGLQGYPTSTQVKGRACFATELTSGSVIFNVMLIGRWK